MSTPTFPEGEIAAHVTTSVCPLRSYVDNTPMHYRVLLARRNQPHPDAVVISRREENLSLVGTPFRHNYVRMEANPLRLARTLNGRHQRTVHRLPQLQNAIHIHRRAQITLRTESDTTNALLVSLQLNHLLRIVRVEQKREIVLTARQHLSRIHRIHRNA